MAKCIKDRKTEHCGPKRGKGAFYGRKAWAKDASNTERRRIDGVEEHLDLVEDTYVPRWDDIGWGLGEFPNW